LQLRAATGNAGSNRVAEKAGFTREGVARNAGTVHGGRVDLVVWSLVPGDLS
jgi:RimJ/RimL family protein N-acetyltransferase